MKDFCGTSMRYPVGLANYKKYGYVPADLEMESVARTLEYAYDGWCIAQMARMLGKDSDYEYFIKRSESYKNVIDPTTHLARGRLADGSWRTPFDPFLSNHRRDDYCEGDAWQWTFFVPHDVAGLAKTMGGADALATQLDSLFTLVGKPLFSRFLKSTIPWGNASAGRRPRKNHGRSKRRRSMRRNGSPVVSGSRARTVSTGPVSNTSSGTGDQWVRSSDDSAP